MLWRKCHNKRYEVKWTGGGTPLYTLTGIIIHGKGNGRKVGMPTANLQYQKEDKLPEHGVYGVMAWIDGKRYAGVTNVGTRPSVDNDPKTTVETYIPGLDMDLYGKKVMIEFYLFLRGFRSLIPLRKSKIRWIRMSAGQETIFTRYFREVLQMRKRRKRRVKKRVLIPLILLAVSVALMAASVYVDGFADWHTEHIYPALTGSIGRIFGLVPTSVAEIGLYLLC